MIDTEFVLGLGIVLLFGYWLNTYNPKKDERILNIIMMVGIYFTAMSLLSYVN